MLGIGIQPSDFMHKIRSIEKWFSKFVVEELDRPSQSPDLNPVQIIWNEWASPLHMFRVQVVC